MSRPAITQAMINAYDEYTHLTLDRRGFMDQADQACRLGRGGRRDHAAAGGEFGARGDRRRGR